MDLKALSRTAGTAFCLPTGAAKEPNVDCVVLTSSFTSVDGRLAASADHSGVLSFARRRIELGGIDLALSSRRVGQHGPSVDCACDEAVVPRPACPARVNRGGKISAGGFRRHLCKQPRVIAGAASVAAANCASRLVARRRIARRRSGEIESHRKKPVWTGVRSDAAGLEVDVNHKLHAHAITFAVGQPV